MLKSPTKTLIRKRPCPPHGFGNIDSQSTTMPAKTGRRKQRPHDALQKPRTAKKSIAIRPDLAAALREYRYYADLIANYTSHTLTIQSGADSAHPNHSTKRRNRFVPDRKTALDAISRWKENGCPAQFTDHNCFLCDFEPIAKDIITKRSDSTATAIAEAFNIPRECRWSILTKLLEVFAFSSKLEKRKRKCAEYHATKWMKTIY